MNCRQVEIAEKMTKDVRSCKNTAEILIVDDNSTNLELLTKNLSGEDYTIFSVASGREALEYLRSVTPDCILLDIRMDDMDGYEVCSRLKSNARTSHIPVLFISGCTRIEDKLKGFAVGGDDFISKPFLKQEILARVRTHVALSQLSRGVREPVVATNRIVSQQVDENLENFYEAVLQADETIVITDKKANIWFVNPAFERTTGYPRDYVLGKNPRILQSGEHDKSFYRAMWQVLLQGKTWKGELTNKRRDGSLYTEKATISPVLSKDGQIINYIAVKEDITRQRDLEMQLVHSQKMETVGRLAGGVAHDFNNMLGVILGTSQMLLHKKQLDDDTFKSIEQIQKAAHRAAETTRRMLSFSRKQIIAPEVVDLNTLVDNLRKMVRRLLGEDIDILFVPGEDICNIFIDPDQLRQIVMNLCINARDAMPDGGKITFETSKISFDEDYCARHGGYLPGRYVQLSIQDTGTGIDPEIMPHIFEPFYTTKEEGKGTGMGLAAVYGAISRCKGFIKAYSEQGQGALFTLFFPCSESVEEPCAREEQLTDENLSLTILLVEDNDLVRDLTTTMLKALGHSVLVAHDPHQALVIVEQHTDHIDLLLTDVIMPGMSGRQLYEAVKEQLSAIKTLFMSGYSSDVIGQHGVMEPGICFIQKPFGMEDLSAKLLEAVKMQ